MPPIVPGYAFHTDYIPSAGGRIRFKIRLNGLRANKGDLVVAINRLNGQGGIADPKIKTISLASLVERNSEVSISMRGGLGFSYAVMGTVSDDADASADGIEINVTGAESSDALHRRFETARREFLSEPGSGALAAVIVERRATLAEPISQMCTAHQIDEPLYAEWCARIGQAPSRHRKQWEFVFICRTLEHYGVLRSGSRGLGFGVGIEPLSSAFAATGCHIVATDLAADDDRAQAWNKTDQLGANLRQIYHPHLCEEKAFFDRVRFREVDMNAIPADLRDFDFTWSSCAYEHLGSIQAGLDFFENSLRCLKPGGIAVHTTELNLSSNTDTLDDGATVIFRRRDFEQLAIRLIRQGHEVIPLTFDSGESELDRVIDLPPYSSGPHLRLALLRWVATSFGMIVRKKA
ncbi:SAM-dependent methyltransferase [Sphingomonas sp. SRS2]|uniref:SAM-dependent methyltransferase n=1 Tax=Sphingomonas sp. SRS2 TaxID=133190 RepID=UPI001F208F63|nr:class I SAM-dependent methyltransferase [Sphingomonas sp. SRS2]